MQTKLFNTHTKVNKFYTFLKANYPVNIAVELKTFESTSIKGFCDQIQLHNNNSAIIYLVYGNKPQKEILHTLAHEYKHAMQYQTHGLSKKEDLGFNGVDWGREIEANHFADKAIQEFKKWKGR